MNNDSLCHCCEKKYNKYKELNSALFENGLVKGFLNEERHEYLLKMYVCNPIKNNERALDEAFQRFYFNIRFVSFISKTLYFSAINYAKKTRKYSQNYLLTVDNPINEINSISIKELIVDSNALQQVEESPNNSIEDYIEHPLIYKALLHLTPKQKEIINWYYLCGLNDTEIGQVLNKSQQVVAKTRRRALDNIKSFLINKGADMNDDTRNS